MRRIPWSKLNDQKLLMIIFFLLLIAFQTNMFSQDPTVKLFNEAFLQSHRIAASGLDYGKIEGSPYYTYGFINSRVYLKNGDFARLPLRYDLFQDEIEFQRNEKTFWLEKQAIKYIVYAKDTLIQDSLTKDPDKSAYFFAKEQGKYSLYIRRKIKYYPFVPAKAYVTAQPDKFEPENDEYYLKKENQSAIEIPNRKTLLEILGNDESVLAFIKKSKTSVKNEQDLLDLVRFLNKQ